MAYTIHPLHLGTFEAMETSNLLYQVNPGVKVRQPILGWLILGGKEPIVVDTGGSDEEWAKQHHHGLQRLPEHTIEAQLQKHGLQPEMIQTVVNTHLHWDHCFQNDKFQNATFYVQKKELMAAVAPLPTQRGYYEVGIKGVIPRWMKTFDRMKAVEGDVTLMDGIRLVHLPGHTPGIQGVLVDTKDGPYLIASDTIGVYENWEGNQTMPHIPQGIHWSLEEYFQTFEKMEKLGAKVLPSHDMRVLEVDHFG
ncbi:N-acyl homoserine lactonase family protein [Brevibacillus massiliensis]|uniref:N-acyl homoserine lactonase family protein n=1 Tax=Brevibacillus massiliensis TaxID=1118054 RepID=UPI0002EF5831|nr:N-acyl homoserine lactonase family protein [Brevibacillus massiliensis]